MLAGQDDCAALKVSDIVTRPLITVASDASVLEACKRMVQNNIGLLAVCEGKDNAKLAGVISERDIIRSIASGEAPPNRVDTISARSVVTVNESLDVSEAAKAMNKHRIRRIVVVDDRNRPKAVVSMRDLVGERATLKAILQSHEKEIFVGAD
jgi:CBS domain-containing protein